MRQIRFLLPASLLILALAGCGDGDNESDSGDDSGDEPTSSASAEETPSDAPTDIATVETSAGDDAGDCYLTDSEVAATTGIDAAALDSSVAGTTICTWTPTTGGDSLGLTVKQETGTFDATVTAQEGVIGPSEPLDGIGDEAAILYGDDLLPQAAVIIQAGDQLLMLTLTSPSSDEATLRAAVTDVAGTLVGKL